MNPQQKSRPCHRVEEWRIFVCFDVSTLIQLTVSLSVAEVLDIHPFPSQMVMRKTCFREKTWLSKAGKNPTLFNSYGQILSGSALVMGRSIVLRLVIQGIDWTRPQLSVNLCRDAEDTVSLRRKRKNRGDRRERRCSHMLELVCKSNVHFQI